MIAKILEKVLTSLIKKERLLSMVTSFALGAACTALGVNVDAVYRELCSEKVPEQAQSQLEQ